MPRQRLAIPGYLYDPLQVVTEGQHLNSLGSVGFLASVGSVDRDSCHILAVYTYTYP